MGWMPEKTTRCLRAGAVERALASLGAAGAAIVASGRGPTDEALQPALLLSSSSHRPDSSAERTISFPAWPSGSPAPSHRARPSTATRTRPLSREAQELEPAQSRAGSSRSPFQSAGTVSRSQSSVRPSPLALPPLAPRLTSLTLALLPTLGRRRRPPLPPRAAPRRRPPVPDRHGQEHPAPAVPPRGRLGKRGQEHRRHAAPTVRPSPSCKLSQVYVELTRGSVHAESPPSRSRSVSQKRSAASSATRCALRLPPNLPARASFVS